MRLSFTGRKIRITPSIDNYVRVKLISTLLKLLSGEKLREAAALDVELSKTSAHHRKGAIWRADATLELPGRKNPIFASAEDGNLRAAIDILADEVKRVLKRYKEKKAALDLRGARRIKKDIRLDSSSRMYRKGRIRDEAS